MKRLQAILVSLFAMTSLLVAAPAPASAAWNPFGGGICEGKAKSSAVCQDADANADDPLTGGNGIIMKIVNLIAVIAGMAAVILIVLAGLRMVTSGGGSEDIAGARRTIIYALVGLVVIIFARTLVAFVLSKL